MDKGRIIEEIDDISLFSKLCHPFYKPIDAWAAYIGIGYAGL